MQSSPFSLRTAMSCYLSAMVLLAGAIVGCGSPADDKPPRFPAKGTVTYNGEPVTEGSVNLVNDRGDIATAPLGAGGAFELETGVEEGTYKVYILPPPPPAPTDAMNQNVGTKTYDNIPPEYREVAKSGLTVDVKKEGENNFKLEMTGS